MTDRTRAILASIDGALADAEFPDAMRWSPEPETVTDAHPPYDGDTVWQPPQRYEESPGELAARRVDALLARRRSGNAAPTEDAGEEEIERESRAQGLLGRLQTLERRALSAPCVALAHTSCDIPTRCLCSCHPEPEGSAEWVEVGRMDGTVTRHPLSVHNPLLRVAAADPTAADWADIERVFGDIARTVGTAVADISRALTECGQSLQPLLRCRLDIIPTPTPEDPRGAALAYRRSLSTGPALLGPERSRRPRRHQ